jgi:hypothetical protein
MIPIYHEFNKVMSTESHGRKKFKITPSTLDKIWTDLNHVLEFHFSEYVRHQVIFLSHTLRKKETNFLLYVNYSPNSKTYHVGEQSCSAFILKTTDTLNVSEVYVRLYGTDHIGAHQFK